MALAIAEAGTGHRYPILHPDGCLPSLCTCDRPARVADLAQDIEAGLVAACEAGIEAGADYGTACAFAAVADCGESPPRPDPAALVAALPPTPKDGER